MIDPRRFPLASVESAYNALRDRDAQGKIIVDLVGDAQSEKLLDSLEGTWPVGDAASHAAAVAGASSPRKRTTLFSARVFPKGSLQGLG